MDAPRPKVRGLSALLANTTNAPVVPAPVPATGVSTSAPPSIPADNPNGLMATEVPLAAIRANPKQPRIDFDPQALEDLAASIKARGLIQPVVVRQLTPEEARGEVWYEIIAGERRWRASEKAGLTKIPVVIKKVFNEREILLLSLVENIQRDDLNPVEEALAYDRLAKSFTLTHEQIADGVGKSRATISNAMRLLELPSTVQEALRNRKLTTGHAKVLLGIGDADIQNQLASKTQAEGLTVRELEKLVAWEANADANKAKLPVKNRTHGRAKVAPPHLQEVERRLREHFGTKVAVEEGLRKGRIVIEFYSTEDFDRITNLMGVEP
jgi:ParB family transcriptional regulator, chromosome partitioning protein